MAAGRRTFGLIETGLSALLLMLWGCGCSGGAGLAQGGAQWDDQPDLDNTGEAADGAGEPAYVALNEGGGDLAARVGGATYSGEATGRQDSGTLSLDFSSEGVLTSLRGTVLGSFFGFPAGTEMIFEYQTPAVTGTYVDPGGSSRPLESFLAESGQTIELRGIVVNLTGDSLLVLTSYVADLSGHPQGERTIALEATLRFQTNEDLIFRRPAPPDRLAALKRIGRPVSPMRRSRVPSAADGANPPWTRLGVKGPHAACHSRLPVHHGRLHRSARPGRPE